MTEQDESLLEDMPELEDEYGRLREELKNLKPISVASYTKMIAAKKVLESTTKRKKEIGQRLKEIEGRLADIKAKIRRERMKRDTEEQNRRRHELMPTFMTAAREILSPEDFKMIWERTKQLDAQQKPDS